MARNSFLVRLQISIMGPMGIHTGFNDFYMSLEEDFIKAVYDRSVPEHNHPYLRSLDQEIDCADIGISVPSAKLI